MFFPYAYLEDMMALIFIRQKTITFAAPFINGPMYVFEHVSYMSKRIILQIYYTINSIHKDLA